MGLASLQVLKSGGATADVQAYVLGRLNAALATAYSLSAADLTVDAVAALAGAMQALVDPANQVSDAVLATAATLVQALAARANGPGVSALLQVLAAIVQRRGLVQGHNQRARARERPSDCVCVCVCVKRLLERRACVHIVRVTECLWVTVGDEQASPSDAAAFQATVDSLLTSLTNGLVCNEPAVSLDAPGVHLIANVADNFGGAAYNAGGWSAQAGGGFGAFSSGASADSSNCKQAQMVVQTVSPFATPSESSFQV
jgi:hypothetical protein